MGMPYPYAFDRVHLLSDAVRPNREKRATSVNIATSALDASGVASI